MSAIGEPPEEARWALALDGIARLERKIDGVAEAQQGQQVQINELRGSYTRVMPIYTFQVFEQDIRQQLGQMHLRVTSLESGTLAAVLGRLQEDAAQRHLRQAEVDRAHRWRLLGQILVAIALLALTGAVLWMGLR